jgi:hypothetical protein
MRIPNLGIDNDYVTVVVLGAGASRGASFATPGGIQPPLDADFFSQVQMLTDSFLNKADRQLLEFIREEFGLVGLPTLETFFTQVEAVDRFHHDFNIQGRVSGKFGSHLTTLRRLIPRVFGEALAGNTCRWHGRLASALRASDSVLSFNYDCLMDTALQSEGGKRWKVETGYGFEVEGRLDLWGSPPGIGAPYKDPIKLLKPHGSLNWSLDQDHHRVSLVEPYDSSTQSSIVPPTWSKSEVAEWPWQNVWRESRRALSKARLMVVVGYSVPITDQLSQALLRADVNQLQAVVIVNPDVEARRRVHDLLASALTKSSTVVELGTFQELAEALPRTESEGPVVDIEAEIERLESRIVAAGAQLELLESGTDEHEAQIDEIRDDLESIEFEFPDIRDEIGRLDGIVGDLDARISSLDVI